MIKLWTKFLKVKKRKANRTKKRKLKDYSKLSRPIKITKKV